MSKLLTIGMATYDDFDGVYFSVQSLLVHHPVVNKDDVEILILDNNPSSKHAQSTQRLVKGWLSHKIRYVPVVDQVSTAIRSKIFELAQGKYCVSMDCHVLFHPGAFDSLLKYYASNPDCKNIISGPMVYDDNKNYSTHFNPTWSSGMYGQWGTNKESYHKGEPFEIPMQGLGAFSCETKNWLGFNKHFKGFGGEEGYIHEKFRLAGGKAICLPQFKWTHRFERPEGVKYPLKIEHRVWNYFIGWLELTQDPEHEMISAICENFKNSLPPSKIEELKIKAIDVTLNNKGE